MTVNWNVRKWGNRVHVSSDGSWLGEKQKPSLVGPEYSYIGDPVRMLPTVTEAPELTEYISDPVTSVQPGPTFGPWADHGTRCRCNVCR